MIRGSLYRRDEDMPLLENVMRTTNPLERMRGLLGRLPLEPGQALLIDRCGSVHTAGMSYPLDLLYLDRGWRVRKVVTGLRPWRLSACAGAAMTLELRGGTARGLAVPVGTTLRWREAGCA